MNKIWFFIYRTKGNYHRVGLLADNSSDFMAKVAILENEINILFASPHKGQDADARNRHKIHWGGIINIRNKYKILPEQMFKILG